MNLLQYLFPRQCCICKETLRQNAPYICPACKKSLQSQTAHGFIEGEGTHLDRLISCAYYKDDFKKAIKAFKYYGRLYYKVPFAKLLLSAYIRSGSEEFDLLVSIPSTLLKRIKRGYNQTEILAKEFERAVGRSSIYSPVLKKIRKTKNQAELTGEERQENLKGAFALKKDANVSGKTILLIDDVTTTSSTLEECAKVLKRGGAARVIALTLAKTGGRG